jgi:hypothetical protein
MIKKGPEAVAQWFVLSTSDHEMYGSNPVSCCLDLGETTRTKDDENVTSSSTMLKRLVIDNEIQGLNPVSSCPEIR